MIQRSSGNVVRAQTRFCAWAIGVPALRKYAACRIYQILAISPLCTAVQTAKIGGTGCAKIARKRDELCDPKLRFEVKDDVAHTWRDFHLEFRRLDVVVFLG